MTKETKWQKKIRKLKDFRTMMIALTYRCQCKCTHCGSASLKDDSRTELQKDEIIQLIDDAKWVGSDLIYFFGGEPLLVPELEEYIDFAKQHQLYSTLDTNGLLLNGDKVKQLKKSGLTSISVSIDSPVNSLHDRLRGIEGIFDSAIEGIRYCKDYRLKCCIVTCATKEKIKGGELKGIIELADRLKVRTRIVTPMLSGKWLHREDMVLNQEESAQMRVLLKRNKVFWEHLNIDESTRAFQCNFMKKNYFYISAYGDIQPCSYLHISFGNIREESIGVILKRMWSSEVFQENEDCFDCPINSRSFRYRYERLIDREKKYPINFQKYFTGQDN